MLQQLTQRILVRANRWHSVRSYEALVARLLREHKGDRDRAMIGAIGALSMETFLAQGDGHVAVLRHHGLQDGMSIYDLGCGSGRTAMALQRSGWKGNYKGADVVKKLVNYLNDKCPNYKAIVNKNLSIVAADDSLDIVFHWSVFTHLYPEECFVYMKDIFRALKPGGKLVFSFLEFEEPEHRPIFGRRVKAFEAHGWVSSLDTFLHRDWIRYWAAELGFADVKFTGGKDTDNHPAFWQALVVMTKPLSG